MAQARRNDNLTAILFLDLDRFKTINDTLGHHVGDQLLKAVAQRLKINSRTTDTIARLGGDEFTIIVENMSHIDEAAFLADKICRVMMSPFAISEQQVFVTASIGVTVYPFDDTDYQRLIRNADTAMYRAKDKGGNTYEFYSPDMNAQIQEWLTLENNLRHALTNDEFSLCYQPRVDMKTHTTIGMEALLRWNNPSLGCVSPAKFIPVLEETGLIDTVGEWIISTAIQQAKVWHNQGWENLRVSINISPRQFRQCDLLAYVRQTLELHQFPSHNLELEITESLLVENIDTTISMLNSLSNLGIHISLDDFGTGYSSLSYLKRFPINTIKIDRSFVKDITTDPDDAAIASAIIAMGRSLKMNITAEGVETFEQLRHLTELGCDEAQGFFFSKPLTENDFSQWLAKERQYKIGQLQNRLLQQSG
jgi:diguanylate cyclase (GGDEF)-like protein